MNSLNREKQSRQKEEARTKQLTKKANTSASETNITWNRTVIQIQKGAIKGEGYILNN